MELLKELYEAKDPAKHKGVIPTSKEQRYIVWHNEYVKRKAKKKKRKSPVKSED